MIAGIDSPSHKEQGQNTVSGKSKPRAKHNLNCNAPHLRMNKNIIAAEGEQFR